MRYLRPELEVIRFAAVDILTGSNETPIEIEKVDGEPDSFDAPAGD